MNGVEIEFLLGLYFTISSLSFENNKFTADVIKLIAGVLLLVLSVMFISPIK